MTGSALFVAVFLASMVEAVEALTIVLAAGTARGWRSALQGALSALALLAVLVALLGSAISAIPIGALQVIVGGLMSILGLQWLRKAILRASGHQALRDEGVAYTAVLAEVRDGPRARRAWVVDWYAFTLSFKGVLLEGIEVAFIVVTFGAHQGGVRLAAVAAVAAVVLVAVFGFAIRRPLVRVPENTMKFVVGVMLVAFGTFWAAEGVGAHWPGGDAALLILIPGIALYALVLTAVFTKKATSRRATVGEQ